MGQRLEVNTDTETVIEENPFLSNPRFRGYHASRHEWMHSGAISHIVFYNAGGAAESFLNFVTPSIFPMRTLAVSIPAAFGTTHYGHLDYLRRYFQVSAHAPRFGHAFGAEQTLAGYPDLWLQPIYTKLAEFLDLLPDWDSYGAEPISRNAVATALRFLWALRDDFEAFFGERIRPFNTVPLAHGGIQLEWRGPRASLEVEIGSNGELSYLLTREDPSGATHEERQAVSLTEALEAVAQTCRL